jgi:hypothetical protein
MAVRTLRHLWFTVIIFAAAELITLRERRTESAGIDQAGGLAGLASTIMRATTGPLYRHIPWPVSSLCHARRRLGCRLLDNHVSTSRAHGAPVYESLQLP